jgi:hypothetical protein
MMYVINTFIVMYTRRGCKQEGSAGLERVAHHSLSPPQPRDQPNVVNAPRTTEPVKVIAFPRVPQGTPGKDRLTKHFLRRFTEI